jgi:hypothetical protein
MSLTVLHGHPAQQRRFLVFFSLTADSPQSIIHNGFRLVLSFAFTSLGCVLPILENTAEEFFENPKHDRIKLFLSQILH